MGRVVSAARALLRNANLWAFALIRRADVCAYARACVCACFAPLAATRVVVLSPQFYWNHATRESRWTSPATPVIAADALPLPAGSRALARERRVRHVRICARVCRLGGEVRRRTQVRATTRARTIRAERETSAECTSIRRRSARRGSIRRCNRKHWCNKACSARAHSRRTQRLTALRAQASRPQQQHFLAASTPAPVHGQHSLMQSQYPGNMALAAQQRVSFNSTPNTSPGVLRRRENARRLDLTHTLAQR